MVVYFVSAASIAFSLSALAFALRADARSKVIENYTFGGVGDEKREKSPEEIAREAEAQSPYLT